MRGVRIIVGLAAACGLVACSRSLTPDQGGFGAAGVIPTTGAAGRGAGGGNVAAGAGGAPAGQGGAGGAGGVAGSWETGVGGEISIGGFSGTQPPDAGAPSPLGPHCRGCTRAPIGAPGWEPVGAVIFREPVGGTADDVPFISTVLAPNHARYTAVGAFGPGTPHAGPYDGELDALLAARHVYPIQQLAYFSIAGTMDSVAILVVVRPTADAPVGRSPDFDAGPIIPNASFPLRVVADMQPPMLDPAYDATIPGYDAFVPPIAADGASHAFLRFRASTVFAPGQIGMTGDYAVNVTVTDATGAGWTLTIVFTIAGDPIP